MKHQFLFEKEPTPEERFAKLTEKEKEEYYYGKSGYDKNTGEGKRVFTMRAARRYELANLKKIFDYLITSGKLDDYGTEKDFISFRNILRVLEEKTPPPTPEEEERLNRVYQEWKKRCEERRAMWEEEEEE